MDQNMDNSNPTPENQPPQPEPQVPPQPESIPVQPQSAAPGQPPVSSPPIVEASGELSKDAKMWGMFCHLGALSGYIGVPFGHILGPLILWLIKKDEIPFVNDQGKEALNFQISITIYGLAILPTMCFPPLAILLVLALSITTIVFIVIASIAANKGEAYRYPLCIRLVK